MSIASHTLQSTTFVDAKTLTTIVPVFVAVMVWVTRILLIGSFSFSGKALFSGSNTSTRPPYSPSRESKRYVTSARQAQTIGYTPQPSRGTNTRRGSRPATLTPRPRSASSAHSKPVVTRPEPEYVPDPSFRTLSPRPTSTAKQPTRRF